MPERAAAATISARGLTRSFGGHLAVNGIDLELKRGEVLGFLGPNGAGKTTTMQMLTGNLAPTGGAISICGVDLLEQPVSAKAHIGYLPEVPPLYRDLTVDEYLGLAARLHRVPRALRREAVNAAKQRCGLADAGRKLIGALSKGYQQRTGIAQAIVHSPDVVILDEPTVGLDRRHGRALFQVVRDQCDAGAAAVIVTHDLDLALRYGGAMWLVAGGRLAARGAPADVLGAAATREAFGLPIHVGALPSGTKFAVPA